MRSRSVWGPWPRGRTPSPHPVGRSFAYTPGVTAPDKPLLVYDGDCEFCRKWIARWRHRTGDRVEYAAFQQVAERFPEIPIERFREAVHLRLIDGRWVSGARAVVLSLSHTRAGRALRWMYERLPGFAALSECCYRGVASHRRVVDRFTSRP